jgi:hydroxypyruvate reductase
MLHLVKDAEEIFRSAVRAVQADRLLGAVDPGALLPAPPASYGRIAVVGIGKAAMAMAGVVEARLGRPPDDGLVIVPHGYPATFPAHLPPPAAVEVAEAGHPVPDAAGVAASGRMLDIVLPKSVSNSIENWLKRTKSASFGEVPVTAPRPSPNVRTTTTTKKQ